MPFAPQEARLRDPGLESLVVLEAWSVGPCSGRAYFRAEKNSKKAVRWQARAPRHIQLWNPHQLDPPSGGPRYYHTPDCRARRGQRRRGPEVFSGNSTAAVLCVCRASPMLHPLNSYSVATLPNPPTSRARPLSAHGALLPSRLRDSFGSLIPLVADNDQSEYGAARAGSRAHPRGPRAPVFRSPAATWGSARPPSAPIPRFIAASHPTRERQARGQPARLTPTTHRTTSLIAIERYLSSAGAALRRPMAKNAMIGLSATSSLASASIIRLSEV